MSRRAVALTVLVAALLPSPPASAEALPEVVAVRYAQGAQTARMAVVRLGASRSTLAESSGLIKLGAWSGATSKVYLSHKWGPVGVGAVEVDSVPEAGGSGATVVQGASDVDLSADGSTMVYEGHDSVYVAPVAGGPAKALAGGIAPRISWDGTKVLFLRFVGAQLDVFVINADGTGLRRLTASTDNDVAASFSPDGTRVLFTRESYTGNNPAHYDLWAMGLDHSKLRHVATSAGYADWNAAGWLTYLDHPGTLKGDVVLRSPANVVTRLTTEGSWRTPRFRKPAPATR